LRSEFTFFPSIAALSQNAGKLSRPPRRLRREIFIFVPNEKTMKKVTPFLWYDGRAQEAVDLYRTVLPEMKIHGSNPMSTEFEIDGTTYIAFNGGPQFTFNEAFSLMIQCDTQEEIDDAWEKLTSDGGSESRCGWLKDKFGMSWQVTPRILPQLLGAPDREKADRAMQAMLKMNKLIISDLRKAFDGE
jgi:predicted 3-demethylubiquinone-9 3-methyltransferase (glyoxalase superfamily)